MNRIKELREQRGMSQQKLAEIIGAHVITVGKVERGDTQLTVAWMERLAPVLGVHPTELIAEPAGVDARLSTVEAKLDRATAKLDRLMAHLGVKED